MSSFFFRNAFKLYLWLRVTTLWTKYRIQRGKLIKYSINRIDHWNKNIPNFGTRFPSLNRKIFLKNYKYWIHWVTKMPEPEKTVFKQYQPIVLVNNEDWVQFDFSNDSIRVFYTSFDFYINKWISINLFDNLGQFEEFLINTDNTAETLIDEIQLTLRKIRMQRHKKEPAKNTDKHF